MFVLEKIKNKKNGLSHNHIVDHENLAELFFVYRKIYNPNTTTWKLVWDGREIPFDIKTINPKPYCNKAKSCQVFLNFGKTKNAPPEKLEPYIFKNSKEMADAKVMAIEALLTKYFLLSKSDTAVNDMVFFNNEKLYRIEDFINIPVQ